MPAIKGIIILYQIVHWSAPNVCRDPDGNYVR